MKVTPVSKTLAEMLKGNFLRIPRFQRPYDWDRDNLTEFWNDLRDRNDPEYFMGSIVVFRDEKEKNLISIVDGQQRVTTITIMLSVIRDLMVEYGEDGPASVLHDLIESRDLDNKNRYVLEHDPADRYFQYAIQSKAPDKKFAATSLQQINLQSAYRFLEASLRAHIKSHLPDKRKAVSYLKHLRDCLLQMHFISVELDNEDDAYLIFETLNTRGKDLRACDLLKNHFMRLLPQNIKGVDYAKESWKEIIEKLDSVTVSIDPDSFLLHYWLANKSSVSKASLFIHYKSEIKKSNAKHWLDTMRGAAATYTRCIAPTEVPWEKEQRQLRDSLAALRVFNVTQAAPLMLAIMTQYEKGTISLKTTKAAFQLIERFTFQFNAVTQSRGGGGVSNMYAKLAQNTMGCGTAQDFSNVLAEMKDKFRERVPDEVEFTWSFSRLMYRTTFTREKNLVRYVLAKIACELGMPEEVDLSLLTIEHILPQSVGKETDDESDVGAIGNLILISEEINGKIGAKDFCEKRKFFTEKNIVFMDQYLKSCAEWNQKLIASRGKRLAKLAYDTIWKI